MKSPMMQAIHPGTYIKNNVIPKDLTVKEAAKLLGVGRPALSNLLNANASLSPEMAVRFEKTFKVDRNALLKIQNEFDQHKMRKREKTIAAQIYVPSFLTIKAKHIESWASNNIEARSRFAVLLRKLVHSTGQDLQRVDFPAYDNSERKGWDGQVESGAATSWIPFGKSGWEFGCNAKPKAKAQQDFEARIKSIPKDERLQTTFVFATPYNWKEKEEWAQTKEQLKEWKAVRAYDASDLEQWLEQSFMAQGWFSEQIGFPTEGIQSLEDYWQKWSEVTEPNLVRSIFSSSIESHKDKIQSWFKEPPSMPLTIAADSKGEALAFLSCLFSDVDMSLHDLRDRACIFHSAITLAKLSSASTSFVPIVITEEVEKEIGSLYKKLHTIIIRLKGTYGSTPNITLDLLNHDVFENALTEMGLERHQIEILVRHTGRSPTILRRRLSKIESIKTPAWTKDKEVVRSLIPFMFAGAWHDQSKSDREIVAFLADRDYYEVERIVSNLITFEDCPIWAIGQFRGVASKIDSFFAIQSAITSNDIDNFFLCAEIVLSEKDPSLELPEEQRWAAAIYNKTRSHSGTLRKGICESLIILAIHGNDLFKKRLGIDLESKVNFLIRKLLSPLTAEKLLSHSKDLPYYAEAAPAEFLDIIDSDLKSDNPQVFALMKPASSSIFGGCLRSDLLWALESLAWKPERLMRVCNILARLSEQKIEDNWVNKPENSLRAIFRSWFPQTSATVEQRVVALEKLMKRFPRIAWQICIDQFEPGTKIGHYSRRPYWRSEGSGAGRDVTNKEHYDFIRRAVDQALSFSPHDVNTLSDLIRCHDRLPEDYQNKVWNIIDNWAKEQDDKRKAELREQIRRFAFTRRARKRNSNANSNVKDRVRSTYDALTPKDIVIRNQWLFKSQWIDESYEELEEEEFDFQKRDARIQKLRINALQEIIDLKGLNGIFELLWMSGAANSIGWLLAHNELLGNDSLFDFIKACLSVNENQMAKCEELLRGLLVKISPEARKSILKSLPTNLSNEQIIRLFRCAPFNKETWQELHMQGSEIEDRYWRTVRPTWTQLDTDQVNELIDKLLVSKRPNAAFEAVHLDWSTVETGQIKRLLREVALNKSEIDLPFSFTSYDISRALNALQDRDGISEEEMAELEFMFIRALDHSEHGFPNLQRQLAKSPASLVQLLAWVYKRQDEKDDSIEWNISKDPDVQQNVFSAVYTIIDGMRFIPGTNSDGKIDVGDLRTWINEFRKLCFEHARAVVGDHTIGQILSSAPLGEDGIWPCESIREVMEELAAPEIGVGLSIGVYNSRGAHMRGEGGEQERELSMKYRRWSTALAFEYPFVSNVLDQIAQSYDRDAAREDSEALIRQRLI